MSRWLEADLIGDTSRHEEPGALRVASSVRAVGTSRLFLGLSALAVAGAIPLGTHLLLVIPAVFALLFLVVFCSASARRSARGEARSMPLLLPDPSEYVDAGAQGLIARVRCAREAIEAVRRQSPPGASFDLDGCFRDVPELERHVVVLAARAEYLAKLEIDTPASFLDRELDRRKRKAKEATDSATRKSYEHAAESCAARSKAVLDLKARYEGYLAAADDVLAALEAAPSRALRLQMLRLDAADERSAQAHEDARGLRRTIDELQTALERDQAAAE